MSFIDVEKLKSVNDDDIPFENDKIEVFTSVIKFDTLFEYVRIVKKMRVVNNDPTNLLFVQTGSPQSPKEGIPPNSEQTFDGWFSKLIVTPHPVTGAGLIDIDLVNSKNARQ